MNWMRWKTRVDRLGERLDRQRLGQTGYAFEQHVAVGQQPDQQPVDHVALPDQQLADFFADAVEGSRSFLDARPHRIDIRFHLRLRL